MDWDTREWADTVCSNMFQWWFFSWCFSTPSRSSRSSSLSDKDAHKLRDARVSLRKLCGWNCSRRCLKQLRCYIVAMCDEPLVQGPWLQAAAWGKRHWMYRTCMKSCREPWIFFLQYPTVSLFKKSYYLIPKAHKAAFHRTFLLDWLGVI